MQPVKSGDGNSFDEFGSPPKHDPWYLQAERVSGLKIDEQLVHRRPLDWQFARLRPLEDAAGIIPELSVGPGEVGAVTDQAAIFDIFTPGINRGEPVARRERDDFRAARCEKWVAVDRKRPCPCLDGGGKGRLNFTFCA